MRVFPVIFSLCASLLAEAAAGACPKPKDGDFSIETLWKIPAGFEALQVEVLPDGRILVASRLGRMVEVDAGREDVRILLDLEVDGEAGGSAHSTTLGLLGFMPSPDFARNKHVFIYYTPPGKPAKYRLSRFRLHGSTLAGETVFLEIPRDHLIRDHTGGSLGFDGAGNLFISTGDNSLAGASSGYSPLESDPGQGFNDAQRSASNTFDFRGKILRIHPRPLADGGAAAPGPGSTYDIPAGNLRDAYAHLWPGDMAAKVLPEIYTMGHRNPFRLAVDRRRGWVHWGEVGPDAREARDARGPMGHDEFNLATGPGNYGWPYFSGFNLSYRRFDFATGVSGALFDPLAPENPSPRNTGVTLLPPALPPIVAMDKQGKVVTQDGRFITSWGNAGAAMGGAFFDAALVDPVRSLGALPAYFHGKLFIAEFVHRWIKVVTLDHHGGFLSAEAFVPGHRFSRIIDLDIPSDGSLYVLEWGHAYQPSDTAAKLTRITYKGSYPSPEACGMTPWDGEYHAVPFDAGQGPRLQVLHPGLGLPVPRAATSLRIHTPDGRFLWSTAWEEGRTPQRITLPHGVSLFGAAWVDFHPRPPMRYPWRRGPLAPSSAPP